MVPLLLVVHQTKILHLLKVNLRMNLRRVVHQRLDFLGLLQEKRKREDRVEDLVVPLVTEVDMETMIFLKEEEHHQKQENQEVKNLVRKEDRVEDLVVLQAIDLDTTNLVYQKGENQNHQDQKDHQGDRILRQDQDQDQLLDQAQLQGHQLLQVRDLQEEQILHQDQDQDQLQGHQLVEDLRGDLHLLNQVQLQGHQVGVVGEVQDLDHCQEMMLLHNPYHNPLHNQYQHQIFLKQILF